MKVSYKGENSEFIVFVDSEEAYAKYKKDSTVALSDVVSVFKIYTSQNKGKEGILEEASKQELDSNFGVTRVEDAILKILKEGEFQNFSGSSNKGAFKSTHEFGGASGSH